MGRVYPCVHGTYMHCCDEQERQANIRYHVCECCGTSGEQCSSECPCEFCIQLREESD
jgi:hypothetical protein